MEKNARPLSEVAVNLLPTPTATLNEPAEWKEDVIWWKQSRATRNLEGVLSGNTPLLKTPTAQLADNGGSQHPDKRKAGGHGPTLADEIEFLDWGIFEAVIRRWEMVLGREAPLPTLPGRTGPRLNAEFASWMMGLPEGWVTAVPGLSRKGRLRAIGNGVVPQQAAMALRILLGE